MRKIILALYLSVGICAWGHARELPLRQLSTVNLIEVDQFKGDDLDKIRKAIAAIPNDGTPTEVRFANREYRVGTDKREPVIRLTNKKNVLINGQGCQLIFTTLRTVMATITDCENIILQNYSIDFDPLHFTQGQVVEVNKAERSMVVQVDEGYPSFADPRFGDEPLKGGFQDRVFAIIKDSSRSGAHKRGSANSYGLKSIDPLPGGRFKLGFQRIQDVAVGDVIALLPHKLMGGTLHSFEGGNQITLMNIDIYGGGVAANGNANHLNLLDVRVVKKPGTTRLQTLCRDAFLLGHNQVGPWLENCEVEAIGDDGLNLHTRGFALVRGSAGGQHQVSFTERSYGQGTKTALVNTGDSLVVYDMFEGKELQRIKVAQADQPKQKVIRATLTQPLRPEVDLSRPDCQERYAVFNINYSAQGFVVRNCRFEHIRRHALFILQGKDGVIEGCTFKQTAACALYTGIEHAKSIGYQLSDIRFVNNTLIDCYVASDARSGAGWIVSNSSSNEYPQTQSTQESNIVVENNRFVEVQSLVFQLSNTNGFVIRNNSFERAAGSHMALGDMILWKAANINQVVENNTIKNYGE